MKLKIKRSNILWGTVCLVIMLGSIFEYLRTGCVQPYFYEAVCGQQAWVILGIYILLGLLGIYLIITGIKMRNKN